MKCRQAALIFALAALFTFVVPQAGASAITAAPLMDVGRDGLSIRPLADTVLSNGKAKVNITNTADGYVTVAYTGGSTARIKTIITGPKGTKYQYDLNNTGTYETFPLQEGDGTYGVGVYVNISGTSYSTAYTTSFTVKLKDQFAPFLVSNQYVNYTPKSKAVEQAATLTKDMTDDLEKLESIYNFVIKTLTYDKDKAAKVINGELTGYLPDIDKVLEAKKGICFDYASLMTAMLRSQEIPCKLVVGYVGEAYHAWINAYLPSVGWVNNIIYFDGKDWKLMDPTFASSGKESKSIMKYIGDGKNYTVKFFY